MKKSLIIGSGFVLLAAAALVFYLNKKDGSKATVSPKPVPVQPEHKTDKTSKNTATPQSQTPLQTPDEPEAIASVTKEQRVDNLLQESHIQDQVDLLAEFFRTGLDSLDPQERKVIEPFFEKALQSSIINYKKALLEKFSDKELDALSAIYKDPDFAAFNRAGIENAREQDSEQMTERLINFDATKLPRDRREALLEIADAELKVGFSDMENKMGEGQGDFKQRLRESFLGRLDILTQGKSVEEIRHIASKINETLVVEQRKLQMQVFEDSMKIIEDAALEHAIGQ